jgi:hypothetical protein
VAGPAECDRTTFCVIDVAGEVAALLHQYAKPEMPRPGVRPGAAATNPGLKLKLKFLQLSRLEVAGRAGPQLRPSRVPVPAPPGPQPDLNRAFSARGPARPSPLPVADPATVIGGR